MGEIYIFGAPLPEGVGLKEFLSSPTPPTELALPGRGGLGPGGLRDLAGPDDSEGVGEEGWVVEVL